MPAAWLMKQHTVEHDLLINSNLHLLVPFPLVWLFHANQNSWSFYNVSFWHTRAHTEQHMSFKQGACLMTQLESSGYVLTKTILSIREPSLKRYLLCYFLIIIDCCELDEFNRCLCRYLSSWSETPACSWTSGKKKKEKSMRRNCQINFHNPLSLLFDDLQGHFNGHVLFHLVSSILLSNTKEKDKWHEASS